MEPHQVPLSEAGGSTDHVTEMLALVAWHPTLDWLRPVRGSGGPHVALWQEDDGPHREERDHLRDLVLYLRARFGR